jgi:hypothetical protein
MSHHSQLLTRVWRMSDSKQPRAHAKRVRAEDLWDRDEEELQQQRAKKFASSETSTGEK